MKIIILGAGQVGGTLAENLVGENNDITIVDTNGDRLRVLQDKFDLRVVQGHGSHPRVLREAGADDADMLVAVTSSDETNMVACQVAYSLFNTPNRIARIRSPDYVRDAEKLFNSEAVPIDHLIAPEQLVIDNIYRLIEYPGALQVVNFAEGKVSLAVVKAYYGGPLIGNALSTMREHMPHIDTRVAAIFRHDRPIRPQGSTIVEAGDEVFFIAASQHIRAVMSELQRLEKPYKRIMLVGGGNIGAGLARRLEKDYSVKLIERDQQRASELAEKLQNTIVFYGDASDQELLAEEHIDQVDLLLPSLMMTRRILCLPCSPSAWGQRRSWCLSSVRLMLISFRAALLILPFHRSRQRFRPCLAMYVKRTLSVFHHSAAVWLKPLKRWRMVMKPHHALWAAPSTKLNCRQAP